MGSQTAFGPRGSATLLSKATTVSAILFMCTSLSLSILATRNAGVSATVLERKDPGKAVDTRGSYPPPGPGAQKQPQPAPAKK